ncbi:hypothetical protein N7499_005188 [Penicillium canescens]|uniref:Uncharacterized protein n=1 Tax=Penicillium canescens TaxID=5083 RepID=A0AAD6N3F4_PENCN|nr:uncharacterized protein N7446_004315 [Penicillium canescens]KAJ6009403.1 hypothetical protein N7522_004419 [Penicillium canescens]KAJ6027085.1 hypothetical protein N7460_011902 [Penicillium canescens]KAJ6040368.1 hypothetical protein N7444_009273 [Penicillium canescens]KAJ6067278.1 hypothetical protein N7446_004315 [Penicillium canescens]KAJ6085559.1 hypothetical protein N7499_005188 [Penicillium canescens]
MMFLTLYLAFASVFSCTVAALPSLQTRAILAYRSWDLRFLSVAPPTCDPSQSNLGYSIFHRYGASPRSCEALDTNSFNATNLKSISWKSPEPSDQQDICMFSTADCSGGSNAFLGTITSGWDVCYLYNGFLGWSVVEHGDACV